MIKLSQYVIGRLADWGVRDLFMITGGGAMHLNDSVGREAETPVGDLGPVLFR
jgi:acetolactate synthase-1/2/3 large subunit